MMTTKKEKRYLALLLTMVMIMGMIPINALAEESGSAWQIEKDSIGSVLYHTLDASGTSTGSDTSETKASAGGKVSLSKTISGTDMENVFDITLKVDTKQETRTEVVSPNAAVVLVLDASTSMDWCASCGEDQNHADHKPSTKTILACPDDSGNSYKKPGTGSNCATCGKAKSLHKNKTITVPPVCTWAGTRLAAAKTAAISFAKQFASDANGAERLVAVVKFNLHGYRVYDWVDAAKLNWDGETPNNELTRAINGINTDYYTNIEAGLQLGHNLLRADTVSSIANKYAVLLTDGSPNAEMWYSYKDRTDYIEGTSSYEADAAKAAAVVAKKITDPTTSGGLGVPLYSVCYGAANDSIRGLGKTVSAWMNEISTRSFSAANSSELTISFNNILNQINLITKAWTVIDPMGKYIVFDTDYNATNNGIAADSSSNLRNYNTNTKTLNWNLNGETHTSTGPANDKTYTYTLTYRVRLDTSTQGFQENKYYLTNGYTELNYAFYNGDGQLLDEAGNRIYNDDGSVNQSSDRVTTLRTIGFKVPRVKGVFPTVGYIVNYWTIDKVSKQYVLDEKSYSASAKLWDSVTLSSDAFEKPNYSFDHGDVGTYQIVSTTSRVFNLYYNPDPASVIINHYYKDINIDKDGNTTESSTTFTGTQSGLYVGDTYSYSANERPTHGNTNYILDKIETNSKDHNANSKTITLSKEENENVINFYYTHTNDQRDPASITVKKIYTPYSWQLVDGKYVEVRGTSIEVTAAEASDLRENTSYSTGIATDSEYSGYTYVRAEGSNSSLAVNGTTATMKLSAGENTIAIYFELRGEEPAKATITLKHNYKVTETRIVDGRAITTTSEYTDTDEPINAHVGDSLAAYNLQQKPTYAGITYSSDATNAGKLTTGNIPSSGNMEIELYYTKTIAPNTTSVTVRHIYSDVTVETITLYGEERPVLDEKGIPVVDENGNTVTTRDAIGIDTRTIKTQQGDPVVRNYPESGELYTGQSFTAPLVEKDGYNYISGEGARTIAALEKSGNSITLYYERVTDPKDVRDEASIDIKHVYITHLTTLVDNLPGTKDISAEYTEGPFYGKAGDSFRAQPIETHDGEDYTVKGTPSLDRILQKGTNSTIVITYERNDSDLVEAPYTVNYLYKTYNMTVQNGVAGYYDEPVVQTFGPSSYSGYVNQQVTLPATPSDAPDGFTAEVSNPPVTQTLGANGNVFTFVYTRYVELEKVTVKANHHYTTINNVGVSSTQHIADSGTNKYIGEAWTANSDTLSNAFTLKYYTVNDGAQQSGASYTAEKLDTDVTVDFYYEQDNSVRAYYTIKHIYITTDWDGTETTVETVENGGNPIQSYAGLKATGTPDLMKDAEGTPLFTLKNAAASPDFDEGVGYTITLIEGNNNTITFTYGRTIDTRKSAQVSVIHHYSVYDRYTGKSTDEGSLHETFTSYKNGELDFSGTGVYLGAVFTAPLKAGYNGRTYVFDEIKTGSYTLTLQAEAENVINLYYQRTVDSTPYTEPTPPAPPTQSPQPPQPPQQPQQPQQPEEPVIEIDDEEVPLSGNPTSSEPATGESEGIEIVEDEVPLGNLPQTGTVAEPVKPLWFQIMMALSLSMTAIGLTFIFDLKKSEEQNQ